MIKRRFYRLDHADGDDASDSSSSSSDFDPAAGAAEESEDNDVVEVKVDKGSCSTSSGYESEDSSINEMDNDTSGLLSNEADDQVETERKITIDNKLSGNMKSRIDEFKNFSLEKDSSQTQITACILKCKSVFKCRICPRIVCLNEETLTAHLKSKRHARSEKLLSEGRLKAILNSNGEMESQDILAESEEQNIPSPSQNNSKRQSKRRKRQSTRLNKKKSTKRRKKED